MKSSLFNIVNFKVDGGAMFGIIPKAMWSRVCKADENNLITLSLRSMIVETEGHVILTDTGWGNKQDEKFFRHVYLNGGEGLFDGLRSRGYAPEDVTDVLMTHLHADHCGGGVLKTPEIEGFSLAFPNAIYHVSRTQWEWALNNNLREEDSFLEENFLPFLQSGHLNLIDSDCELFEGFSVRHYFGHTPGLLIPFIKKNSRTMVFAGDLIPTVAHIPLLWNMSYDLEQLKTIDEKSRLLEEALTENYILIFQHDEATECCTLMNTPKGIRVKNKFAFSEVVNH